ncbi:MAG: endonuclease/exonuclease/phosphatase family protein [Promethearchaeota archaeon]
MVVSRILEPLLSNYTQIRMIVAGLGVACFLIFLPLFLYRKYGYEEEQSAITIGLGLSIGLALSILFRTIGSSIDISTYSWFQSIGWILAIVAGIMFLGLVTREQKVANSLSLGDSISIWRTVGLTIGLIGILMMIYYTFASPTVVSRWTEGNYFLIVFLAIIMLTLFVVIVIMKRDLLKRLDPWIIWLGNALFVISLVLTIMLNQTDFSRNAYPIDALPTTILNHIPLILMIFLFPIILVDFMLISREVIINKPTLGKLAVGFALASMFFLLMIFAHVFTTVYDYIDVVGPFFRDMFWFVYLIGGLSVALPVFFVRRGAFIFDPFVLEFRSKIVAIVIMTITIGTIFAAFLTAPTPPTLGETPSITVLTYNIQQGYSEDGIKNIDGQLHVIKAINPDIIGLQECDTARIANGNMDVVRYFANNLNMYSYYGPKTVTGTFGIALLSKYPIMNPNTFFMSSEGEQAATITAQIKVGTILLNAFVTHLGNGGPLVQQEEILDRIEGKNNLILIGDFNFRPGTIQYNKTMSNLNDSWLISQTSNLEYLDDIEYNINRRIDHIFVSFGVAVSECEYIVSKESDHPAVWAEIIL